MSSVDITPSVYCALMVPEALEADLDASTVGQAGPIAGVPEPAEDSAGRTPGLTLSASGAQTSTTTLSIATQDAGNVGEATYRVKRTVSGVADAAWRGADLPNVLTGFSGVGWASSDRQTHPHAVTLPDDTQVVCYAERPTALDPFSVKVQVWSPTTETYASAVTVVSGLDSSHIPHPWLLVMPDPQNRNGDPVVLLGHWDADDANNAANINLYISRDGGATWSVYARSVLDTAVTLNSGSPYYTLGRARAAMVGAQIVLFAYLTSSASPIENVFQYASSSAGASFTSIGVVGDSTKPTGFPDVVSVGAVAYLVYTYDDDIYLAVVRNPFVRVTTGTEIRAGVVTVSASTAAGTITVFEMAVTALPNGIVAVPFVSSAANRPAATRFYNPVTAEAFTTSLGGWWQAGASPSTEHPTQLSATPYRGQVRVYANMDSSSSTYENKLTRLDLGGLTTVTMPTASRSTTSSVRVGWDRTYIPLALPSAFTTWTRTTTGGSDDVTTTIGRHRITTAASTRYYTLSSTLAATDQMMSAWRIWQASGGSVAAREIVVGLRWARAGIGFDVELRCSATQIRSFDVNGATTLSTASVDVAGGIEVLMALGPSGKVSIWYREIGTDEDRNFLELETQTSVTDDAGVGGTTGVYKYGSISVSTATAEYIPLGKIEVTEYGINDWATAFANPTTLRGIPYGVGTYALAGVKLTATGGPTLAGDAWTVSPDATYPIRNLLPVGDPLSAANVRGGARPSPREDASGWRSTATSGYLAFRHRGSRNRWAQSLLVVHEEGLNTGTYPIYGYNEDAAAWELIGTGDKRKTVRFTRTNANSPRLKVDTGNASTDEPYLYEGELAGGWFEFPNGDIRPIVWNGEGRWSADGAHGLPYLELDPDSIDGGEDTTGAGKLWYPRSTFYAYLLPTKKYSKYALYWSSGQSTYTGDLRANIVAIGYGLPIVRTRDFGCIWEQTDPSRVLTMRSGLRFGTALMNAPRLNLTIPLVGPQDQSNLLDASTAGLFSNPFKLTSTSSMAYAGTVGDAFGKLMGAHRRSAGARDPLVYIHRLAYGTPDTGTLCGWTRAGHYGRMTSQPRFTDRFGRDTGAEHGSVYVGENVLIEGEL